MNPYQIAAYYFPNYHSDARNAQTHGPGWTEWELVRHASPRFEGHRQPRVPMWGYEDESDPWVMARKIDAAADHGLDAFIFDWYRYDDGPYLERGLDEGFLGAPNNARLKFALMWANHDWYDIHPARLRECQSHNSPLLYPGTITRTTFETAALEVIARYFKHPSYWKINGAPYFSIYDLAAMLRSLDGFDGMRDAFAWFRAKTKAAGFPDLHLNQVYWNFGILPGEQAMRFPGEALTSLGFDSITSYVWVHHVRLETFPETDFTRIFQQYLSFWEQTEKEIGLPYFPNASVGWDSSPRTVQSEIFTNAGYPFSSCIRGNAPGAFQHTLEVIKQRMNRSGAPKILTINSWNEWTEGSYLEPDTQYGLGYLDAIRNVFGG